MTDAVVHLRSPEAIRERCGQVLALAEAGELAEFGVELDRLDAVSEAVVAVTREAYPDLAIPYHSRFRHFATGGVDRVTLLREQLAGVDADERVRAELDLVVTSVLLDAGAGPSWSYHEDASGQTFARSEGLAVASFDMFGAGAFSTDADHPLQASAAGLEAVTAEAVGQAFQVSESNPLVGLEGRADLLRRLGQALRAAPEWFGSEPRVGNLLDALRARAVDGRLEAREVLNAVLVGFGPIWPGRVEVDGVNLGDVWRHPQLPSADHGDLVPFHKLSQWLTYSLLEPLEGAGLELVGLDALTGLAEYRNGGLLVDLGVVVPKNDGILGAAHRPESPVIVGWRALTVALLDAIADRVRASLGLDAASFPLAKVLEGGTWAAGRKAARERRPDGSPPIRLDSDGTVF